MPDFMVLIHENEASSAAVAPRQTRALLESQVAFEHELRSANAYRDGERLRPSAEGRRVSRHEAGPRVELGPFAAPTLAAYYVLSAASLDAALELAQQCPASPGAELEVRPLMKGHFEPGKTSEQGRVFAFGVLGSAPNEAAWIDVMDRIDESTQDDRAISRGRAARGAGSRTSHQLERWPSSGLRWPVPGEQRGDRRAILPTHGELRRSRGVGEPV